MDLDVRMRSCVIAAVSCAVVYLLRLPRKYLDKAICIFSALMALAMSMTVWGLTFNGLEPL